MEITRGSFADRMLVRPFACLLGTGRLAIMAAAMLAAVGSTGPACAADAAGGVSDLQRIIHRTKPAVVRIYDGFSGSFIIEGKKIPVEQIASGSGFFVHSDGYVMTNAHVVSMTKGGEEEARKTMWAQMVQAVAQKQGVEPTAENLTTIARQLMQAGVRAVIERRFSIVALPDGTMLPFEIKSYGAPLGEAGQLIGKDVAILKVEISNAPTLQLADSSKVAVGDRVYVTGFPGAADSAALSAQSQLESTTTAGAVSAIKTSVDGIRILQTDAAAGHGNSGGPVVNDAGRVVGLLTFGGNRVNNQEVQGFTFIVPSNTASEYLRQSGVENKPGLVDERWLLALQHYWNQEYKLAKPLFEEVRALYAKHSEAEKLIRESQEKILRGEDRSSMFSSFGNVEWRRFWPVPIIIMALITAFERRRRARAAADAPAASLRVATPAGAGDTEKTRIAPRSSEQHLELVFDRGPLAGQRFTVPAAGLTIGRDARKADVVVPEDMVSGRHLWIGLQQGRWVLRDEGSSNGTFIGNVNGARIKEHVLRGGETVVLGEGGSVSFQIG